jgi:hypothetical protein
MPSTYSPALRLELIGNGEQAANWGNTTNTNLGTLLEQAIAGVESIAMSDANYTLVSGNGISDEARNAVVIMTGTLSTTRNVVVPTSEKFYAVRNATTGGQSIVVKTSAGTGVTLANGFTQLMYCDGTNVVAASVPYNTTTGAISATLSATSLTGAVPIANGGTNLTSTPANGQVLIGNGTGYSLSTLTAGTGITITNGAGSITIANSGGTVNSVDVSGGTTGLTASGGPITTSGTITLGGTLGVANGGTGTATTFTSGSVVFAGASGVYSQNNSNLFWNNANNRLGINTATPSQALDVVGAATVSGAASVSGNLSFNSGYGSAAVAYGCRAWVNFNGTGTVAIRASANVTSITDNGTGDYTVNFTNVMPDVNYSFCGTASPSSSDGAAKKNFAISPAYDVAPTTSALRVYCGTTGSDLQNGDKRDSLYTSVAIFR